MWWGEEISQPALPPAPDPSRSQRRTLGATRAHTHTLTSATLSLCSTPAFTHLHTSVWLPCLGEGQAGARPAEGRCFSVSCGHFSGHTGLLTEATVRPRPGSHPRVFKQVLRETASRPAPWSLLCLLALWSKLKALWSKLKARWS